MPVGLVVEKKLDAIEESLNEKLAQSPARGLSPIQVYILEELYARDNQHASDLARAVNRAATAFTPVLDSLEDLQLIKRMPDPADRRAVFIKLTVKGHSLRTPIEEILKAIDQKYAKATV